MTMEQRKQLLNPKNAIKSSNVDRNKHELYFRFLAFNKKREERGKRIKKKGGTKQDIATRKNEELLLLKK
jgi:hypothetical protein